MTNSTARCWGYNNTGQLGNNSISQSNIPVTVVDPADTTIALTGIASISAGNTHACAVMTKGTARCWGYNNAGQLGNNSTTGSTSPVTVLNSSGNTLTGVVSISAGFAFTCAVTNTGNALCWGTGNFGKLGNNAAINSSLPVTVVNGDGTPLTGVASIGAGQHHACATLTDGTARCWGWNVSGQLGTNTTTNSSVAVTVVDPSNTANALSGIASISVGNTHACALLTNGTALCWGSNFYGNLGNNTATSSSYPVAVLDPTNTSTALSGIAAVSAGNSVSCARMTDGTAKCWGLNYYGNLGNGGAVDSKLPVTVSVLG